MPNLPTFPCRASKNGVELFVRATPKAAHERISDIIQDANERCYLKIYVTATPEDGKANEAIINLLAKTFKLPKTCITLTSGATHHLKCFELEGISVDEVIHTLKSGT